MFDKLLKKVAERFKLDKAADGVNGVVTKAEKMIDRGENKINVLITLVVVGVVLGIAADVVSIAASLNTISLLKK